MSLLEELTPATLEDFENVAEELTEMHGTKYDKSLFEAALDRLIKDHLLYLNKTCWDSVCFYLDEYCQPAKK